MVFSDTQSAKNLNIPKIHKPNRVRRPIISDCEGPTERLSFCVDKLLQPIAQQQRSYLKDTTDFINFIEKTKVSQNTILVSMDVTSLYTNIPQEEGIKTVCKAYEKFHNYKPPIPSHYLKDMLGLILKENLSNLWKAISSRPMEPQWVQKWQLHLPTSSWRKLKVK